MELIVWLDGAGQPEGFQICYTGGCRQEHALTWRERTGFVHSRVDAGDLRPGDIVPVMIEDADEHDLFGVPAV